VSVAPDSLLVRRLDLLDESVDFLWRELASVLGHVVFAVGNDGAEFVGGRGGGFVGDERWSAEAATLGGFSVAFCAVFLEDGVPP
jgi:hypothetical protein